MRRLMLVMYLWSACMASSLDTYCQNTFEAVIQDSKTQQPLPGASAVVEGTTHGASADVNGKVIISNIPDGEHTLVFSYIGYETREKVFNFPLPDQQPIIIALESSEEEMEEVIINATRSSRTIENIPTRIEAITAEELGEKAVMNSANIAMLLRESTGIQMQQTSANSANQSIRIQGLDGRYTQLLRDGFPLFGGFSGGLSIMQIPPLDLRQVEVIKGSASTLYGGGAIAGLINLVTKKPVEDEPELSMMFNQTSAAGTTVNGFYSQKFDKTGYSFYASGNRQAPYDPNEDNFSDIPKVRSLTLSPRFFYYPNDSTTLWLGMNTTWENRVGGDISVIEGSPDNNHVFTEQNLSERYSTQLQFSKILSQGNELIFKNSISYFNREISIPDYRFEGQQLASFTELSYAWNRENSYWITGGNLFTDHFNEEKLSDFPVRDYQNTTLGAFAQNTWDISQNMVLESGLRTDYNTAYGAFILPRVSFLYKPNAQLSGRIGGGMGYKLPTIFTEEAERLTFQNIHPIAQDQVQAENSVGGNFDINYQTLIGDKLTVSFNQLFFYTQIYNALVLSDASNSAQYYFENADGIVDSRGFESNLKLTYGDFKLFLQYAFTDVRLHYDNVNRQKPLTPKHAAGAVLMFEQHGGWRIGFETYYTGAQYLSDYTRTTDFLIMGLMALREFPRFSLFLNFENFTDTRQSVYQDMVRPPVQEPSFAEIWAPTDGFVINGGFILKLFGGEDHH